MGVNRHEHGNPAGIRTTMLVCFAATLAQLQADLLLDTVGKTPSSFSVLDLERLPLGILSGIGFIGAGVIMKRDHNLISVMDRLNARLGHDTVRILGAGAQDASWKLRAGAPFASLDDSMG